MKPNRKEIAKGIFLYTERHDDPVTFVYEIECAKFRRLAFTIDFTGTVNFSLEGSDSMKKTTLVNPYERKVVARMTVEDADAQWSLKCRYQWKESQPDETQVSTVLERDREEIARAMKKAAQLRFDADSATVEDIKAACRAESTTFVDLEFPPVGRSLAEDGEALKITWRRPAAFMEGPFDVFVDLVEPNDIRQGNLGDCWLMCALSSLAEFPVLVERLFPSRSDRLLRANEAGIYEVRFCKNGEWRTVKVDDFFPCFPEGGPVYSRSHGNELWVLLVEKAYAKLHGSYAQLRNGWAYEALMDLTGAPSFSVRFADQDVQADIKSGRLWERLLRWDEQGYLMSCSTPGEDKFSDSGGRPGDRGKGPGLVSGHAYTLIAARQTREGHQLLCLRNPWGDFEWTGDWSDGSPLWTEEIQREVGAVFEDGDGLFWMSLRDFLAHFVSVNVCEVRTHADGGVPPWREVRRKGAFAYERGSGAVSAPHYALRVEQDATHLWVGVHQEDERVASAKPYLDLGVAVLRRGEGGAPELVAATGISVDRQAQLELTLDRGEYLVVPVTTGCRFALAAGEESPTRAAVTPSKEDAESGGYEASGSAGVFNTRIDAALREVFRRLDRDMDGVLSRAELNEFARRAEGVDMNDDVYHWLLKTFDSRDGGITADGFVECYVYMFEITNRSPDTVWRDLHYFGYDNDLDLAYARTFVVSVHAEGPVEVEDREFDAALFEEAVELPITRFGTVREYRDGAVKLYCHKAGYWGVAFAAENCSGRRISFKLDCSSSKNVVSHRGDLVYTEEIPPGETKVMHHLMPAEQKAWAWGFKPSFTMY